MPARPASLSNSMIGLWTLQLLATGNQILDRIRSAIANHEQPVFLRGIDSYVVGVVQDAFNSVVSYLVPSVPGVLGWLQSDASWLETLTNTINQTLWLHRSRILYIQFTYIRQVQLSLESSLTTLYNNALLYTRQVQVSLQTSIVNQVDAARQYTRDVQTSLEATVAGNLKLTEQWVVDLNGDINAAKAWALQQINYVYSHAIAYTDQQVTKLSDTVNVKLIALAASVVALGTFLTTVFIPDAIAAAIAALNLEAAVAMDVEWELVATQGNKALAELTAIDLDPVWLTYLLSEIPATSIAAADLDITAALRLLMGYLTGAGVPLYKNLRQFGEDTSELDGIITTTLLGVFFGAAILDPTDTATVVTDVLLNPLADVLDAVGGLLGITEGG